MGYWINTKKTLYPKKHDRVIKDNITLIQILFDLSKPLSTQFEILELICNRIKRELKQTSLLIKINNEAYFI